MSREERDFPEGSVPLLDVEGTAAESGRILGHAWIHALQLFAKEMPARSKPWWQEKKYRRVIRGVAPHLPDLFQGMAKGAGLPDTKVGAQMILETNDDCTSFALHPRITLDGHPISGQTKDTQANRVFRYQVLRLKLTDGASALTLTYPGWLFGHGFVEGGCSIFRNSLYAGEPDKGLPYPAWGLLALHCKSVAQVKAMTKEYGVRNAGHCTVADTQGGILGVEITRAGVSFVKPKRGGIYTHANHVVSRKGLTALQHKTYGKKRYGVSQHREAQLYKRLAAERGRLTAQLAFAAMIDHTNYPNSICRHAKDGGGDSKTTAAVAVEPTRGLLHATRGAPCQNWPQMYSL